MGNKEENIGGFEDAVYKILNDIELTKKIINLIPSTVILPLYYKGDKVFLKDIEDYILITDVDWKNGGYIYYFYCDGEYNYTYESDLG